MPVVLVRPPFQATGFDQQFQEPLNLCYLAAVLRRDGFEVHVVDAELEELDAQAILSLIADDRPEMVGISLMSYGALAGAVRIAEGIRQWAAPKAHITLGGHFATYHMALLFRLTSAVDSIIPFEGEMAVSQLARLVAMGNEDWRNAPGVVPRPFDRDDVPRLVRRAAPIEDLDTLPLPARDLLPRAIQLGLSPVVLSSRGCSGRCSFCTIFGFMRQSSRRAWRGRSPGNVVAEIQTLVDCFRVGEVGFMDDDFIGTKGEGQARATAIADLLRQRRLDVIYNIECRPDMVQPDLFARLRDSGLRSVFIGIEGVSQQAIRTFNKGISYDVACRALDALAELQIDADVGFILYHPYATLDEVWEGYEFLKRYGQFDVHTALNRLYITPGAPIRNRLAGEGRLRDASSESCLGAEDYEFSDRRVGVLLAILRVVVFPLFPLWYEGIKEFRRLRAGRQFERDSQAANERMHHLRRLTTGINGLVARCFEEAYRYAARSAGKNGDLLDFARGLLDQARREARRMAQAVGYEGLLVRL